MSIESSRLAVLMISTDTGLIETSPGSGDVLERHQHYADHVSSLDIIVFGGKDTQQKKNSDHLTIHPTGVRGFHNIGKARRIGQGIFNEKKINLIVTQDPHGAGLVGYLLKKKYGTPLLVHFHGDFWNSPEWRYEHVFHVLKDIVQRRVVRGADAIRVVSAGIKDKLILSGISAAKIAVINTPVNDRVFSVLDAEQKILLEKVRYKYAQKIILLFCGRFVAAKNLFFMIDALDELRKLQNDVVLLIIGEGPQRVALEDMVKKKKLESHVFFLGGMAQDKMAVFYHLAHALLLFSTNESFGKVIIEAGLAGTPTLASATLGATSIIDEGKTGFISPINDLAQTVGLLQEIVEYPEHMKLLGQNAQRIYQERYASETTFAKIISLWSQTSL